MCFNRFEWSQVEEISRKLKEKKSGRNRSKNRGKQSSAKFRRLKKASAKSALCCKTIPQHYRSLCEGISQLRKQIWHTSATSQYSSIHLAAAKRIAKWKCMISHQKSHFVGYFAIAKVVLAHECHFAAQEHPFRSCETHCEVAAKMAFCCEIGVLLRNLNWPLGFRFSYLYRSFELRKGFQKSERHSLKLFVFFSEPRHPSLRSSSPISNVGQSSVAQNGANERS